MKSIIQIVSVGALAATLIGCASDRHARHHSQRYVIEEQPGGHMVIERDGSRTYVREYEARRDYRGTSYYQNNMEPRVRGKHPDSLGWNTESYYIQRGY